MWVGVWRDLSSLRSPHRTRNQHARINLAPHQHRVPSLRTHRGPHRRTHRTRNNTLMLTLTDLFAGAGGSSTGATQVPGVDVRIAAIGSARENVNGPEGATNTARSLTRSLDETKEGLTCSLPATSDRETGSARALTAWTAVCNSHGRTPTSCMVRRRSDRGVAPATRSMRALDGDAPTDHSRAPSATSASDPRNRLEAVSFVCSTVTTTTRPAHGAESSARDATPASGTSATTLNCSPPQSHTSPIHQGSSSQPDEATAGNAVTPPAARDVIAAATEGLVAA